MRKSLKDIGIQGEFLSDDLAAIQIPLGVIPLDILVRQIIKATCRKKRFCERLTIVIPKEVAGKHKINLRKLKHYIESCEIENRWKF